MNETNSNPIPETYDPSTVRIGLSWVSTLDRTRGTELLDEALVRQVSALGYPDAYEAINALCEVNVGQGQPYGYDFYLSVPLFIHVVDARVVPSEKRMRVTVRRHHKLHDIKGMVFLRGTHTVAGQPYKATVAIDSFSRSEEGLPVETATVSVELPDIDRSDWVDVRLTHPIIGEVDGYFSREVRTLIPSAERNILFEALKHFRPDAEFEGLLVRPYAEKPKRLKKSAAFEVHVAWLLGLFGCATIVLGKYERLIAPQTKVELGSVDILALTPNGKVLLLVACTLGTPEERDFSNLLNVRGLLERGASKTQSAASRRLFLPPRQSVRLTRKLRGS